MRWEAAASRLLAPGSSARLTTGPGEASELARRGLLDGFEALVAVGGDGTLSEVVDAYLSASQDLRGRAALGTLPVGSGCDFARHFGISSDPRSWPALLEKPLPRRLDAGRVEFALPGGRESKRHFLNVAALGLAGEVALRVSAGGKPWGGALSYLLSSLSALMSARARPMDIIVDGRALPRADYHLVVLANTSTTGGGMKIAPSADPQDSRLDLLTVGGLSRWELLRRFPSIYTGAHIGTAGVTHELVRRVEVRSPQKVFLNIDGEAVGVLPAVFEVLPAAVPFLCPATSIAAGP